MAKFRVHMTNVVSTSIEVEADDAEDAIEKAYDSNDMPGSIGIGAFGSTSVDDSDWEASAVTDEFGDEVWSRGDE